MNLKEIEAIVTVAVSKSFFEAAYTLNYSPSVISKYVSNVEKELGVRIFIRGNRSADVSLTKEGKALLPQFMQIHKYAGKVRAVADIFSPRPAGQLKIGTGHHVASLGMEEILAEFFNVHPEIHVEKTKLDFESQINALYSGRLDGIFSLVQDGSPNSDTINHIIKDPKVESYLLNHDRNMFLGVSEKHFPEGTASAPLAAFKDFYFVFHSDQTILKRSGTMLPFLKLCAKSGFELKPVFIDPRDTSTFYLAAQRNIAIPSLRGHFNYPGIRFIRVEDWDSFSESFFLALKSNPSPELALLKKSVRNFIKQRNQTSGND